MPQIASASFATFTVPNNYYIAVQSPGGWIQLEYPTGTNLFEGNAGSMRVFGPFSGGSQAKLTSVQGPIYYELAPREAQNSLIDLSNVAITGGNINGTAIGATTPASVVATAVSASTVTASGAVRGSVVNTAIATVGNGTLTAAAMTGGVITRSGSIAAYSDTTDTAAAIVAAISNAQVGTSFDLTVINSVAFADTIAAGAGVTLAGTTAIAASTWRRFIGTVTNVATPAVTLTGIASGPL